MQENLKRPLSFALASYLAWGIFPLYWQLLKHFPSLETLAHRVIWSFVFYLGICAWRHLRGVKFMVATTPADWGYAALAALLLATNWGIYIYAVTNGHVLESSLAYFINPLMSVAAGVWLFREEFPPLMKFACLMALAGVLTLVFAGTGFPWIALTLATTFCAYGMVKKVIRIRPTQFSTMEGAAGFLPALAAAIYFRDQAETALQLTDWLLLIGGGVVTGLPLFFFAIAARELPYSLLGMIQFVSPTLQFLCGWVIFGERLELVEMVAFGLIWVGIGGYYLDRLHAWHRQR